MIIAFELADANEIERLGAKGAKLVEDRARQLMGTDEKLVRIFDPYFSTKQRGSQKGMGLGLTIAYSIVKRHEGSISMRSNPGIGTAVDVYLPVSEREPGEIGNGYEVTPIPNKKRLPS